MAIYDQDTKTKYIHTPMGLLAISPTGAQTIVAPPPAPTQAPVTPPGGAPAAAAPAAGPPAAPDYASVLASDPDYLAYLAGANQNVQDAIINFGGLDPSQESALGGKFTLDPATNAKAKANKFSTLANLKRSLASGLSGVQNSMNSRGLLFSGVTARGAKNATFDNQQQGYNAFQALTGAIGNQSQGLAGAASNAWTNATNKYAGALGAYVPPAPPTPAAPTPPAPLTLPSGGALPTGVVDPTSGQPDYLGRALTHKPPVLAQPKKKKPISNAYGIGNYKG